MLGMLPHMKKGLCFRVAPRAMFLSHISNLDTLASYLYVRLELWSSFEWSVFGCCDCWCFGGGASVSQLLVVCLFLLQRFVVWDSVVMASAWLVRALWRVHVSVLVISTWPDVSDTTLQQPYHPMHLLYYIVCMTSYKVDVMRPLYYNASQSI